MFQLKDRLVEALALAALGIAATIGVLARLWGLSDLPLAVDEYYYVTSTELIREQGVPLFATGGYYFRGPIAQYAIAGMTGLFGTTGLTLRLPGVLFGLASVFLIYLYARRFVPVAVAAAVAAAVLLSSWEIEFSRFIRMYPGFQAATLLLLLLMHEAYCRGHRSWRYMPHVGVAVAILFHELGILFVPLVFLPLVPGATALRLDTWWARGRYALVGSATLAFGLFTRQVSRWSGVDGVYPADYVRTSGAPLVNPSFPFWQVHPDPLVHLALVLAASALLGLALVVLRRRFGRVREEDIWLALLLWFSLNHLFWAAGLALCILLARVPRRRWLDQPRRTYVMFGLAGAVVLAWLILALLDLERLMTPFVRDRWDLTEAGILKVLWTTFFGWPDPYSMVIRPIAVELPVIGLALAVGLVLSFVYTVRRSLVCVCCHPSFIIVYTIVAYGVLSAHEDTTRYLFHLYPVILLVIAWAAHQLWLGFGRRGRLAGSARADVAGAALFLVVFALSSDFNPRHWWAVADEAVILRTGPYERFEKTWYWRPDYQSPARFIEQKAAADDDVRVVLMNVPPSSYYLSRPHAVYYPRDGARFRLVSRERGTIDLWSNQRLLSTPEGLKAYTRGAEDLWLIQEVKPSTPLLPDLETLWGERLRSIERAFVGRDGRIEVLHIELAPSLDPA